MRSDHSKQKEKPAELSEADKRLIDFLVRQAVKSCS